MGVRRAPTAEGPATLPASDGEDIVVLRQQLAAGQEPVGHRTHGASSRVPELSGEDGRCAT
jgi:hypothetical protein